MLTAGTWELEEIVIEVEQVLESLLREALWVQRRKSITDC
jgi:hypothetical protein